MTSSNAWPEGVIARYLTVAGVALSNPALYVEVTLTSTEDTDDRFWFNMQAVSECTGCPAKHEARRDGVRESYAEHLLKEARRWAQSHAETCPALPNPNA